MVNQRWLFHCQHTTWLVTRVSQIIGNNRTVTATIGLVRTSPTITLLSIRYACLYVTIKKKKEKKGEFFDRPIILFHCQLPSRRNVSIWKSYLFILRIPTYRHDKHWYVSFNLKLVYRINYRSLRISPLLLFLLIRINFY